MTLQLTKNQHYVPQFYLKLWSSNGKIYLHNLMNEKVKPKVTKNILSVDYYYEENLMKIDNRVEKMLGGSEDECAPVLKELNEIKSRYSYSSTLNKLSKELTKVLTEENIEKIKRFAAFQYLRVPGVVCQKKYELGVDSLNPGMLVGKGYEYIKKDFIKMNMTVMCSFGEEFITSDWPCFDMKDSDEAPVIGEELGKSPDVICYMAFGPKLAVVFSHPELTKSPSPLVGLCNIIYMADGEIKNCNKLVIQQSERYVVASQSKDYVFKIAAKRKKHCI